MQKQNLLIYAANADEWKVRIWTDCGNCFEKKKSRNVRPKATSEGVAHAAYSQEFKDIVWLYYFPVCETTNGTTPPRCQAIALETVSWSFPTFAASGDQNRKRNGAKTNGTIG